MNTRPYQHLTAWKEAYALCLKTYAATKNFPAEERFGLTSQMRRSASSIPINIAEGNTKKSQKERAHFFEISLASLNELHCEYLLAKDLNYLLESEWKSAMDQLQRASYLLTRLQRSLAPLRSPRRP